MATLRFAFGSMRRRMDGLMLSSIGRTLMNNFSDVDMVVEKVIRSAAGVSCASMCASSDDRANLTADLPLVQKFFKFSDGRQAQMFRKISRPKLPATILHTT